MSATRCCEQCGTPLPPRAPGGLCPKCLLAQAVHAPAEAWAADEATSQRTDTPIADTSAHRFGDYELLEKVAEGGMGVVYRARQLSLNRIVAVKMIQPGRVGSPEMVLRFRAEAEAAASLHHPNIVPIHETGECEGQHFFSMDYIEGRNLADAVREGPLPSGRAAELVGKIAAAVHHAHQHGILHRDLKPSNVILDEAGEPQVTDFGLARRLGGDSTLTLTGQVFGSPRFMPPEQASGRPGAVGVHSDVYGLGAILYYLLTARPPFVGETMETTLAQVLEQEPVSPRLLNASVPRDLETICLKCLEKEPSRRYASAQAVADELDRFLEKKPILARPVGLAGKIGRWCRRKPALATALGAVVLVAAVGFAGIVWQWRQAEQQRRNSEANELSARQNAYAADMNLAQRALEANDVRLAVSLLNKHRPADSSLATRLSSLATDLRGWEWRYLWQLCQGEELFTLHRFPASIGVVAVSSDGRMLAVQTGWGGKAALWDLTAKRPITEVPDTAFKAVALSPNGCLLAVANETPRRGSGVDLWDVNAGKLKLASTLTRQFPVRSLALSPDGKLLATFEASDEKGAIAVLDWASNKNFTNFTVPPLRRGGAGVVVFSPDGNRLAVGADYGEIQVLNWRTGAVLPIQTQTSDGVTALVFSPTAPLLAAGFAYTSGTIRLWDPTSGEPRGQLTNHTGYVNALAFTPDGRMLASGSVDQTIRIWNVAEQTELRCLRGHQGAVTALAFLPDGKTLVSGGADGSVRFWDLTTTNRTSGHTSLAISFGSTPANLEVQSFSRGALHPKAVARLGIAFTPDSRSFLTTDPAGDLGVWDAQSVRRTETLPALGSNLWGVALSPNGRWLAVGEATGKVHLWDWPARRLVATREIPFDWCGLLHFSRSSRFLLVHVVSNDEQRTFKLLRTDDWQGVPFPGIQAARMSSSAVSPDDRLLATGYANGAVKLCDFPSGAHETTLAKHKGPVCEVLFSSDGRMLACAGGGQFTLWDVFARRELATLRGHWTGAWSVAFSSDGRRLATGGESAKDAVKLWDLATQREMLTLPAEGQYFVQLSFSPDGNTLVAISLDGMAHFWRAPSWSEIATAERGAVTP